MAKDVIETVVSAIIAETVDTLPSEIYRYYMNPPGRNPSMATHRISEYFKSIPADGSEELIRDIVDTCVFSVLYLVENKFKNLEVQTSFTSGTRTHRAEKMLEIYRSKIQPGGTHI